MKYNSSMATNSTEQARHDRKGTDQLNMLQENKDVRLVLSSVKIIGWKEAQKAWDECTF